MKKLTSIISGTFLLVSVAGVAKAGDTIELTAAQMDGVTAGFYSYSVNSSSQATGHFGGYGTGVGGASESAAGTIAIDGWFGPISASGSHNVTIGSAFHGAIYGSSSAGAGSSVGYGYGY
jgi:hypothetical protein